MSGEYDITHAWFTVTEKDNLYSAKLMIILLNCETEHKFIKLRAINDGHIAPQQSDRHCDAKATDIMGKNRLFIWTLLFLCGFEELSAWNLVSFE